MLKNVVKKVVTLGLVACIVVGAALMAPVAASYYDNDEPAPRYILDPIPDED